MQAVAVSAREVAVGFGTLTVAAANFCEASPLGRFQKAYPPLMPVGFFEFENCQLEGPASRSTPAARPSFDGAQDEREGHSGFPD